MEISYREYNIFGERNDDVGAKSSRVAPGAPPTGDTRRHLDATSRRVYMSIRVADASHSVDATAALGTVDATARRVR